MKIHHFHHATVIALALLVLVIFLMLPRTVHAYTCELNNVCNIKGSDLVQIPVTAKQGLSYRCDSQSLEPLKRFEILFVGGKSFSFPGQLAASTGNQVVTLINGKFTDPNQPGAINIKNMTSINGRVSCYVFQKNA
jgi:hypothetical protein